MRANERSRLGLALTIFSLLPAQVGAQDGFGGARDNGLVRDQVAAGYVPSHEAFTVEGFLSEHHFPVRQDRCDGEICVFAAMGHGLHRPTLTRSGYLLVEPVSGLDPDTFRRAPLNVGLVIDVSGSMTGTKLGWALAAAHALVDQLGPEDTLSIVSFADTARLDLPATPVRQRTPLHAIIDTLGIRGGTNVYAGARQGFEAVAAGRTAQRADRVFLLTDERPNVGVTDGDSFLELVGAHAGDGVGITVVGVGLDLGAELASSMAQLDGGAYYYLEGEQGIASLFGPDFDQRVTPVAYRIAVTVHPGAGLRVADVFGVPEDNVVRNTDGSVTLRANTLFLDRRRSGAILRLEPTSQPDAALSGAATITYSYVRASDRTIHTGRTLASHRASRSDAIAEFSDPYHYRAYALVNFAQLLRSSLTHWSYSRHDEALRILGNARAALELDSRITEDAELAAERLLADEILATMVRSQEVYASRERVDIDVYVD